MTKFLKFDDLFPPLRHSSFCNREIACVAGVKRGSGRGNLGALGRRERNGAPHSLSRAQISPFNVGHAG